MAGNDRSKHPEGEEPDLTEEQLAAVDRLRKELDALPRGRRQVFREHLKGLKHGEEGGETETDSSDGGQQESDVGRQSNDAGSDHSGDRG